MTAASTRIISLNSTDSLPIPPRSSSRNSQYAPPLPTWHVKNDSAHTHSPSRLSTSILPPISPTSQQPPSGYKKDDTDNTSIRSIPRSPPSPSPSNMSSETRRSSRKPVPPYLQLPSTDLPADHPFSSTHTRSPSLGRVNGHARSVSDAGSGSEIGTPGWREDKDLFFSQQQPARMETSLPPPPRRPVKRSPHLQATEGVSRTSSFESVAVPLDQAVQNSTQFDGRRGTFDGGLNINMPGMNPEASISQITATTAGYETAQAHTPSAPSTPVLGPDTTPRQEMTPTERPLPPLPDGASAMSVDLSSILENGPAEEWGNHSIRRSNSSDSRPGPQTPKLAEWVSQSPVIRGDGATSSVSSLHNGASIEHAYSHGKNAPENSKAAGIIDDDDTFSVSRPPSKRRLWEAGTHSIRDEEGRLVYFSALFPKWGQDSSAPVESQSKAEYKAAIANKTLNIPGSLLAGPSTEAPDHSRPTPKTVLLFIRFFWCGQCQDYMMASLSQLDPEACAKANIRVVVISTGSWKFIKKYRKLTKCAFPIYATGSKKLYDLLGMKEGFMKFGSWKNRAAYNQSAYPIQMLNSFKRAPLLHIGSSPGNINQMGGEFIIEPGYDCTFAHRMTNFSNHMEAPDILRLAGCESPTKDEVAQSHLAENEREELARLQDEMDAWKSGRETELDRIRRKKAERRGLTYKPISNGSRVNLGLEEDINGTPAFPPTSNQDRRDSAVSALSVGTVRPGLEVSIGDAVSERSEAMEELDDEPDLQYHASEKELAEQFATALRVDEEAKGRFEHARRESGGLA